MATGVLRSVNATQRVYVRGVDGYLGRRVLSALAEVDGLDVATGHAGSPAIGRFDTIVELGVGDHDTRARRRESVTEAVSEFLADAENFSASHLVVVSSAMVYGAFSNNPVPITEDSVLRPVPEFVFARQLASAEELVEEWRRADGGRSVTVLRPALGMAEDGTSALARALAAGLGHRFGEDDPVAQFVHLDDVASAVALAVALRLDGVYNVAPDGWIPGERVRALTGDRLRLPLPERVREVVAALRWRFQRGPIPPGLDPYTREPWVVANDKLRAAGWTPTVTNEQTYVEGTEARWWAMVTPKRRQELSLGAMVAAIAAVSLVAFSLVRRWVRRRRARRSV
jgi:nucleoside-diphosphate-sugar epimerase